KYRAYLFGAALAGLSGALFAAFISAVNPSAWTPSELLGIYAAILVRGRGNPLGGGTGGFAVYIGLIEPTRFLPAPASRPEVAAGVRPGAAPGPDRAADHPDAQVPARGPDLRAAEQGPEPAVSAAAGNGALLEIEQLSKSFGGIRAVHDCSFAVRPGQVLGLIGPNGAGKSTVVDLVSGFGRPDSGSIRLAGRELIGLRPDVISRLGLIRTFQTPREWRGLTVMDNV